MLQKLKIDVINWTKMIFEKIAAFGVISRKYKYIVVRNTFPGKSIDHINTKWMIL